MDHSKRNKILVVGGGPAGTAAAIALLKRGYNVALFEKGGVNREKVCGDGLAHDAQLALRELGVFDRIQQEALRVTTFTIFGYHNKEVNYNCDIYTLQRAKLDQILRDEVERLGGTISYNSSISKVETSSDEVLLSDSKGRTHKGDCLVLATGANVNLARQLGFEIGKYNAVAMRAYAPNNFGFNPFIIWYNEKLTPGYGWIFSAPGDQLNVGVGYTTDHKPRENLNELMNTLLKTIKKRYRRSIKLTSRPKRWVLRTGLKRENLSGERVLLVGENVHTTYNFTEEGIGKALQSGIIAGKTIANVSGDYSARKLSSYDRRVVNEFSTFHDAYNRVTKLFNITFCNFLFTNILAHSKKARRKLEEIVEEKAKPSELYSISGLLKTIFL